MAGVIQGKDQVAGICFGCSRAAHTPAGLEQATRACNQSYCSKGPGYVAAPLQLDHKYHPQIDPRVFSTADRAAVHVEEALSLQHQQGPARCYLFVGSHGQAIMYQPQAPQQAFMGQCTLRRQEDGWEVSDDV
ncbi:hypothetical protein NDU88_002911 [Pleurodeles waltl]|uniref:Uncharacterized protein n=1 Tax=Pleurodeles waltl TaxID=8319 RepID=A0AAV7QBD7_PLEWA|nr:hypothetical protein NDU88_002911 [Pleurodeles waltl]